MDLFSNNILLSNLLKIRWIAIIGQLITIITVFFYLNISIPIKSCLGIVLISALVNIYCFFNNNIKNYLSDSEAFYFLIFDTLQLSLLLFLTGGIYNPFSLLLIAPLIISASYLPIFFSIFHLFLSFICVIIISNFYFELEWKEIFKVPQFYVFGLTFSLIISFIFIVTYVYFFANSSRHISLAISQSRSFIENQKKISEIGSLSAAAVHELSTPLNTIFLILSDLKEEKSVKKNFNIKKEIDLLKSQADRCREILLTLSKNPENLKDNFLDKTTISNLIKINFDKFNTKGINLKVNLMLKYEEPKILFKDELLYAVGNIIQNAIQHAKSQVETNISWDNKELMIIIKDDGEGFINNVFEEIGKPYISKTKGMGLGIFIAKNLIENIGGKIFFKNAETGGAFVEIMIKRVS